MGKGYKHGGSGGGNPLNFIVKAYPSEAELKAATPKENTIGVITTTSISSWIFSATEPAEPEVGMVWISVGTSSDVEFNALKTNGIQVYPLQAKQYISVAWVDVTAMSYQNGEWVDWIRYLYNEGDQCVSLTGGWEFNTSLTVRGEKNPDPRSKFDSDSIYVVAPAVVNTKEKIDLSMYSNLCFDVYVDYTAASDRYGVFENFNNKEFYNNGSVYVASVQSSKTGRYTIKLDISSLKTSYYVAICTANDLRSVYKVWLE